MFKLTPLLARLRNPASVPPNPDASPEAEGILHRMRQAEGLFLGLPIGREPGDVAQRLDLITGLRQHLGMLAESGKHGTIGMQFNLPPLAEVLTAPIGDWERSLLIVQSEQGPAVQVFGTSIDAITAFRTGIGLVRCLEDWRNHALFGVLILQEIVVTWNKDTGESTLDMDGGQQVIDTIMPNIEQQLELIHRLRREAKEATHGQA
jgi:hypothetical protein